MQYTKRYGYLLIATHHFCYQKDIKNRHTNIVPLILFTIHLADPPMLLEIDWVHGKYCNVRTQKQNLEHRQQKIFIQYTYINRHCIIPNYINPPKITFSKSMSQLCCAHRSNYINPLKNNILKKYVMAMLRAQP